jgi:hypothetical protein
VARAAVTPFTWALTFHAERLHEDVTWAHLSEALARLERRQQRATLFVAPARARLAGFDLRPRLTELCRRGHELALHTHFYERLETEADGRVLKVSSFDQATIERCLEADTATLEHAGCRARGFVAGGFARSEPAFRWLGEHGFAYDASFRAFASRATPNDPGPDASRPFRIGELVEVLTSTPLRGALRQRCMPPPCRGISCDNLRYTVVYLHDYDLLRPRARHAWRALVASLHRSHVVTARELAGMLDISLRKAGDDDAQA